MERPALDISVTGCFDSSASLSLQLNKASSHSRTGFVFCRSSPSARDMGFTPHADMPAGVGSSHTGSGKFDLVRE